MIKYQFQEQPGIALHEDVDMKDYTTFQLGGPCAELISCMRPVHLTSVVAELNEKGLKYLLVGAGSNVVISDEGLDQIVLRYWSSTPCIEPQGEELVVSGSTLLDGVAHFASVMGLAGVTFANGIPGTLGGAIVGNAGAFGEAIGERVVRVALINNEGETRVADVSELGLGYRTSLLQQTKETVLSARLKLSTGERDALMQERERILALRAEKHPNWKVEPCAGSVFRNLQRPAEGSEQKAAGWLLEQAGAKEMSRGGARVYEKHANIIVKASDDCTAQDVRDLVDDMRAAVAEKFQIELVPEIRFLGNFA